MLKLSANAVSMLISKYRAVLKRMFLKNAAAFAAGCVIFSMSAAAGAADVTYDDTEAASGAMLQQSSIGDATSPSLFPGTPAASGNQITVDYISGANHPYRVYGGLSDSAAVTGNTVNFRNGYVTNDIYGGYDAASSNGAGASNNTVNVSGGTIGRSLAGGYSEAAGVEGNRIIMTNGTVVMDVVGGNTYGDGTVSGNSVEISDSTVGGYVYGGNSQYGDVKNNSVSIAGNTDVTNDIVGAMSYWYGNATGNSVTMSGGTAQANIYGGISDRDSATAGDSGGAISNTVTLIGGNVAGNVYGGYDFGTGYGNALNNQVSISGTTNVNGNVIAGIAVNGLAQGNIVTMSSGSVGGFVFGGYSSNGQAVGNRTVMSGGTVEGWLYGGTAVSANGFDASNNEVEISGGLVKGRVVGGNSEAGKMEGNTVLISGGEIWDKVVGAGGGLSTSALATANKVVITDGLLKGHVLGGVASNGSSTGNSVTISGGTIEKNVYGGEANDVDSLVENNQVAISGGTIQGHVLGGYSNDGLSAGNTVYISGGTIERNVLGGESYSAGSVAENNQVFISGGTIQWNVTGGYSTYGLSTGNAVTVTGGTIGYYVNGGFSESVYANGNTVTVTGGTIGDRVNGGLSINGDANDNTVTISGGTIGNIYGGYSDQGNAINNTVILSGQPVFNTTTAIYGGYAFGLGSDSFTGNTLTMLNPITSAVQTVGGFEYYRFLLPATAGSATPMLAANDIYLTDGNGGTAKVDVLGIAAGGVAPRTGDSFLLLGGNLDSAYSDTVTGVKKGVSLFYDFDVATDSANTVLTATVRDVQVNPQTKAFAEGRAAGLAFVNQGADLAADRGMADALLKAGQTGGDTADFGAVAYGSSRYKTGSHADVDGTSLLIGFASRRDTESGALTRGVFLEGGWGSYDAYNSFANAASVTSDGDVSYYGLGALMRLDKTGGSYIEGSVRGGKSKTTFNSGAFMPGQNASYDSKATYYGAHVGIGQATTNGDKTIDYYAKYFWTHQGDDAVSVFGDPAHFAASDSSRLRAGVRLSREKPDGRIVTYAGLAYEYEFDGKAKATVYGYDIDAPSLKGGTGIVELGMSWKCRPESNNTLQLSLQGYTGQRKGVTGNIQLKRVF